MYPYLYIMYLTHNYTYIFQGVGELYYEGDGTTYRLRFDYRRTLHLRQGSISYLWLVGKEGIEKNMEATVIEN